jgi:hypothetical protein
VIRAFVHEGRLTGLPVQSSRRRIVLLSRADNNYHRSGGWVDVLS